MLPAMTHGFDSGVNCIFSNDHLFWLQPTDFHYISSPLGVFEVSCAAENYNPYSGASVIPTIKAQQKTTKKNT